MYEISIKTHFSAAHHLRGYQGTCEAFHGHNWEVEVFVKGAELNEIGILIDFRVLREAVQSELTVLDHSDLNAHPEFSVTNPTSEHIARFLFTRLSATINSDRYRVSRVAVNETPGSKACYSE